MNAPTKIIFERDSNLEGLAEAYYDSRLHYHNFQHVLDTLAFGNKILKDCYSENVPLNKNIVYLAILFHDAGYFEDHQRLGFETKEKYSANLAESVLVRENYPQLEVEAIKNAIISTEKDATFETAEQQAVRAADLFGMAESYDIFLLNNIKLKKEHEYLNKSRVSWDAWKKVSVDVVKDFITPDIPLIGYFKKSDSSSQFSLAVEKNLERFTAESVEPSWTNHL
jgi:predicted metal-dependent HD superfamily phosphohydrolase